MYYRLLGAVTIVCIAAGMGLESTAANAQNLLTDLGVATGHSINNNGQVALDQGIYSNGTITPLPALPGQTTPATPNAISETGQVAGSATAQVLIGGSPATQPGSVPIAYTSGTLTNLSQTIPPFGFYTALEPGSATAINASGQIVGYYQDLMNVADVDPVNTIGFIYANGTSTTIGFSPNINVNEYAAVNMPYGINDSGQITGAVIVQDPENLVAGRLDAYFYSGSGSAFTDLGYGTGYAINASGQVTGTLITTSGTFPTRVVTGQYAFLYGAGNTQNIGTLPGGKKSIGYAINTSGQVVGSSDFTGSTSTHAFFYNGVMVDLNTLINSSDPLQSFVTLTSALGINDSLLVLANGVDSRTGLNHAYLLQAPFIQVAPSALSFLAETVGGASAPQSVVITNAGSTAISLGTISISSNFSLQSNGCAASLAPHSACTLMVAFSPATAGTVSGGLTTPSAGVNYVVALSGVGSITDTLSASASTATVGNSVTLTWTASPGSTCTASSSFGSPQWMGNLPTSGTASVTDTVARTNSYQISCAAPGTPAVAAQTSVVWTWPPVIATLTASPTTITAGQSTTLTWSSSNATSCVGTGGASGDNWAGPKAATSGSQTVTEPFIPANPSVTITFGVTCTSSVNGLSDRASVNVTDNQPPPAKSGGGGALDPLWLMILCGVAALNGIIQSRPRTWPRGHNDAC